MLSYRLTDTLLPVVISLHQTCTEQTDTLPISEQLPLYWQYVYSLVPIHIT